MGALLLGVRIRRFTGSGLATSRGAKVPDYVSGKNRRYTVKQIATHKGVQEALLKEITSWVALSYLNLV